MEQAPPEVHALLKDITVSLQNILDANLTGIYLYGSLTQDAFDPEQSDIDCLVVTQGELSDKEFTELGNSLARLRASNPWTEQLQMQFLLRDKVLAMNSKSCLYQFGKLGRGSSDGNPIVWMNILKSGVVLFGQPPSAFVPEITPRILHEALVRETVYLREEIENPLSEWRDVPKYRAYAVLTLCRILYSHATGEIASKPVAANFVINNLPEGLQEVVRTAMGATSDKDAKDSVNIPLERIRQFVELTLQRLKRLKEKR